LRRAAHGWARKPSEEARRKISEIEAKIDQLVAGLCGITDAELKDIQLSLADLQ